jgi:hypothetical protein
MGKMTYQHPITPPLKLLEQWEAEVAHTTKDELWHVAVQAARWGADQELEACVTWIEGFADFGDLLRTDRRPKQLSQKQRALDALAKIENECLPVELADEIRLALKTLPDD